MYTYSSLGKPVRRMAGAGRWGETRRNPGCSSRIPRLWRDGTELEDIPQYTDEEKRPETAINRPGFAHIAFAVDDAYSARDEVIASGGKAVGVVISLEVPGVGIITFVYVTDPEGNVIGLQKWMK